MFRKFLSELFFNTSLGNGFYSDLSAGTFVVLIIFIILSFLLIKFSEYIKVEFLFGLGLLLSSITTINVLRYKPYGGDAKIYCDLTSLSKSSNLLESPLTMAELCNISVNKNIFGPRRR